MKKLILVVALIIAPVIAFAGVANPVTFPVVMSGGPVVQSNGVQVATNVLSFNFFKGLRVGLSGQTVTIFNEDGSNAVVNAATAQAGVNGLQATQAVVTTWLPLVTVSQAVDRVMATGLTSTQQTMAVLLPLVVSSQAVDRVMASGLTSTQQTVMTWLSLVTSSQAVDRVMATGLTSTQQVHAAQLAGLASSNTAGLATSALQPVVAGQGKIRSLDSVATNENGVIYTWTVFGVTNGTIYSVGTTTITTNTVPGL